MLVVDIGNTALRVMQLYAERKDVMFAPVKYVATLPTADKPDLQSVLCDTEGEALVVVSVVPDATAALFRLRPDAIEISSMTDFPFTIAMPDQTAVGADRYCNVAAAVFAGFSSALIVDIGTATTFDLLLNGCFAGGLIAPGPATAARSLQLGGARLPEMEFKRVENLMGTDTIAAMQSGCWQTTCHGIKGTIEALLAAHGPLDIVLTGGLGDIVLDWLLQKNIGWACRSDRAWTVRGAAGLALKE
jgi:type III pantothenate kinase